MIMVTIDQNVGTLQQGIIYFFTADFFATVFGLMTFFFGKLPSNKHCNPLLEPHPSSFSVTEPAVKINFRIQGSPSSRYSAIVDERMMASPFNSPLHCPLFFSK